MPDDFCFAFCCVHADPRLHPAPFNLFFRKPSSTSSWDPPIGHLIFLSLSIHDALCRRFRSLPERFGFRLSYQNPHRSNQLWSGFCVDPTLLLSTQLLAWRTPPTTNFFRTARVLFRVLSSVVVV
jgi:hypothetical protein